LFKIKAEVDEEAQFTFVNEHFEEEFKADIGQKIGFKI
jgi:hypothetical protein